MKILIIDDTLSDRLIIRRHLVSMEHDVMLAENGLQGINTFNNYNPDIVLLDLMMPEMNGYEVVKKLRDIDTGWRPILFLSSTNSVSSMAKGIYSGADDFLHKPIDKIALSAKLHAMERIVNMRQQLIETSRMLDEKTKRIQHLAYHDDLTGIYNRRFLNTTLDQEFRRHLRESMSLSIIMIDIDHFKRFNDNYGHLAGDNALKQCAQIMNKSIKRAGEFIARYGGEEFCVVLPATHIKKATEISKELCQAVINLNIPHHSLTNKTQCISISLGVSTITPKKNNTINELIHEADTALYQSKKNGRNQVTIYSKA